MSDVHDDWVDVHSVTCVFCGDAADERETANITDNLEELGPAMPVETPLVFGAIQLAVAEFGRGEAHQSCFDAYLEDFIAEHTPMNDITVDGRFTSEGISVSAYDEDGDVLDETWFTWGEVEDLKGLNESAFTFEITSGESERDKSVVELHAERTDHGKEVDDG